MISPDKNLYGRLLDFEVKIEPYSVNSSLDWRSFYFSLVEKLKSLIERYVIFS
jgi:hypothetical protein